MKISPPKTKVTSSLFAACCEILEFHSQCKIKFLVILDLNGVWQILVFHCPFIFPLPKPSAQHDKQRRKQQQQSPEDPHVDVDLSHCNTCTDTHISSSWIAGFKLQPNVHSVLDRDPAVGHFTLSLCSTTC